MFEVTLIYKDNSLDAVNTWVNEEKTRPYWEQETQVQIIDKSQQS